MPDISELPVLANFDPATIVTPGEFDYWKLRNSRTFFIDYEFEDDYRLIELAKSITQMNMEEKDVPADQLKPIYIFIQSYGGDMDQAFYFADLLTTSRIPIVTVATGVCMSAGCIILLAGTRRYAFKHSQILIHSGSAGFSGTAEQIAEAKKNYDRMLAQMKDYIVERTVIDSKTFNKNKTKDWYIGGKDIEQYGVAQLINNFADITGGAA